MTAAAPALLQHPKREIFPPLLTPNGLAFPRGRVAEIFGAASSGRTTLLIDTLAHATGPERELCALVDTNDTFDPHSASAAGVVLHRLLWIRCGGNIDRALRSADLLLQANGFGLVALDLASASPHATQRIPPAAWYRLRNAVENTRTIFAAICASPLAKQCAMVSVEAKRRTIEWSGAPVCSRLLDGAQLSFEHRKPFGAPPAALAARA